MTISRPNENMRVVELDSTRAAPPPRPREYLEEEPTLGDYLATIVDNRVLIAAVTAAVLALSILYLLLVAPTWRSDVMLQVEDKTKGIAGLDDLADTFSEKTPADTEMEIIRSRSLIGSVVDELNLTIEAQPRTFPFVGGVFFRRYEAGHLDDGINSAPRGLDSFAWGGERIAIARLDLPDALLNQPVMLVAGTGRHFTLKGPEGDLVSGEVGTLASQGSGRRHVEILVNDLHARPGTEFNLVKRHRERAIDELQNELRIAEKGKKTGIISISLDGKDRERIVRILDAIARNYVRQNIDLKSAEAAKTLEFVQQQLPVVRHNADVSAAAFKEFQEKHKSVDLDAETQALVDRSVDVEKQLSQAGIERVTLRQHFTEEHPLLLALKEKERKLKAEQAELDSRLHHLPRSAQESVSLSRDAKVASDLYILLLNKGQELEVVKSGTIGNVRILDTALRPFAPVSPKKVLVIPLALLIGLFGGIGLAFLRKAMDQGVEDPVEIEMGTGISVYASVPLSEREAELSRQRAARPGAAPTVLTTVDPGDLAIESLRSLRTALQFALVDAPNKVVSICGPSPEVGKSFLAANLAHVLAQAGKRVLLLDCDLRRGQLHRYLGGSRNNGISEVISGQCQLAEATRKTSLENLDFISTGKLPPNPSEMVASPRFTAFLNEVSARYDLVILDLPPILAVTDASLCARHAGVNLLVLRAGKHPMGEIAMAVKHFANAGVTLHGVVLNGVVATLGRYSRYAHQHHYHYAYRSEKT